MCGRTACTLAPDDVCRACGYKDKQGKWTQPQWRNAPGGQRYYSSHNVAPGSHTPVLLSKSHQIKSSTTSQTLETTKAETNPDKTELPHEGDSTKEEEIDDCEWVVQPMHWGLVPSWNQGDVKSVGYSMINARSETALEKRSFKIPLEKGRRCVVLVDGYFEWQTGADGKKQPYFLYFPHVTTETVEELNKELGQEGQGDRVYTGRRLLTLAGLFDVWHPKNGDPDLYSYSIITVDAHKQFSWLHSRMPAVLEGEEEVRAWLDSGSVPLKKAMELIRPVSSLHYHPVSSAAFSNVEIESEECIKPIDLEQENGKKRPAASEENNKEEEDQDKKGENPTDDSGDHDAVTSIESSADRENVQEGPTPEKRARNEAD